MSTSPEKPTIPLISRKSAMSESNDSLPHGYETDTSNREAYSAFPRITWFPKVGKSKLDAMFFLIFHLLV